MRVENVRKRCDGDWRSMKDVEKSLYAVGRGNRWQD